MRLSTSPGRPVPSSPSTGAVGASRRNLGVRVSPRRPTGPRPSPGAHPTSVCPARPGLTTSRPGAPRPSDVGLRRRPGVTTRTRPGVERPGPSSRRRPTGATKPHGGRPCVSSGPSGRPGARGGAPTPDRVRDAGVGRRPVTYTLDAVVMSGCTSTTVLGQGVVVGSPGSTGRGRRVRRTLILTTLLPHLPVAGMGEGRWNPVLVARTRTYSRTIEILGSEESPG